MASKAKIVMISGKQGSGKTTTSEALAKYLVQFGYFVNVIKFADVPYLMHNECLRIARLHGLPVKEKDGKLLQVIASKWGRKEIGEDVWVNCLKNRISTIEKSYQQSYKLIVIVDDLRFRNEFDSIPHALRVRLECERETRMKRCTSWRDTEYHESEIDLDMASASGIFDKIYDTAKMDTMSIVTLIAAQLDKNNWIEKR